MADFPMEFKITLTLLLKHSPGSGSILSVLSSNAKTTLPEYAN